MYKMLFENPLYEKTLTFSFTEVQQTTRFERWSSYIEDFQKKEKKAVDFICLDHGNKLTFFVEIKDFIRIDTAGQYGQGLFSQKLAEDIAQKIKDTIEITNAITKKISIDEHDFVSKMKNYPYRCVFHWEFKPNVNRYKRMLQMKNMKSKLKSLLHGVSAHIQVENIKDSQSKYWEVIRCRESRK